VVKRRIWRKVVMQSYNIHIVKMCLSKPVDKVSAGELFIIAKAGKPLVKVIVVDAPEPENTKGNGRCYFI